MRQPIWIINSTLLVFFLISLIFLYFLRTSIPEREDIEPKVYSKLKKEKIKTNIEKIYEQDLFGTYQPEVVALQEQYALSPFPEPPSPLVATAPAPPQPKFLDPLDITLKGIFVVTTDSSKNRAILQDNKTQKEGTFRVGDAIDGAQLIRIYNNKILFLRPNGQQEVLYLREQDAKEDPAYALIDNWQTIIQQVASTEFLIDPQLFAFQVNDLGQFIEMVGLTTAYKDGQSVGCRIGQAEPKSLAAALGLITGDIIKTIDTIPATTTENRLKIYQSIVNKNDGDTIKLQLLRNKQPISFEYQLKDFGIERHGAIEEPVLREMEKREKEEILRNKYQFAPTLKEIKKRERIHMINKGKAPAVFNDKLTDNKENNDE